MPLISHQIVRNAETVTQKDRPGCKSLKSVPYHLISDNYFISMPPYSSPLHPVLIVLSCSTRRVGRTTWLLNSGLLMASISISTA